MSPTETSITADTLDLKQILSALTAFKNGDFSVRMPVHHTGLAGKVADTLNEIVEREDRLSKEYERVSLAVGKEGKTSQRIAIADAPGGWASAVTAVNTLIADLVQPTNEMARVIGAVAKGDLSQTMALEIEGRPLKGEFLRTAKTVNGMVEQLGSFAAEVTRVAREVGTEGKLKTRLAEGLVVANKIARQIACEPIVSIFGTIKTSVSIGVALVSRAAASLEDILILTKLALQNSKDAGRNQVIAADNMTLEMPTMEQLLSEDYISVFFQPIFDLNKNKPFGYQALCRGRMAENSNLPDVFKLAKNANRLTEFDLHCLRLSVESSKERRPRHFHCNVFPSTLLEARATEIAMILGNAADATFCLNLNEQEMVGDPNIIREEFASLRNKGIYLVVKDISFGSRSLEALLLLSPEYVRISKAFLVSLGKSHAKRRSWARLLNMCKALSSEIIVEGIENQADAELLEDLGANLAQGCFFGGLEGV